MNFLAHMYLSFNQEEILIGNFIADFVKGKQIEAFTNPVKTGILLHREIDRFTDSHDIVRESKKRLSKNYRHYAAVIVDIYFDHFLAKNWSQYSAVPLKEFTTSTYKILEQHDHILPEKCSYVLKHMRKTDWMYNYQFLEGIDQALSGMARRTTFESKMEHSIHDLKADYELYYKEFKAFFVELVDHTQQYTEYLTHHDQR